MKMYLLTQADLDRLRLFTQRDPRWGTEGGSSDVSVNDPGKKEAYDQAHRFYNYQVCKWIDEVSK